MVIAAPYRRSRRHPLPRPAEPRRGRRHPRHRPRIEGTNYQRGGCSAAGPIALEAAVDLLCVFPGRANGKIWGKIWAHPIRVPRRHRWLQAIWLACSSDRDAGDVVGPRRITRRRLRCYAGGSCTSSNDTLTPVRRNTDTSRKWSRRDATPAGAARAL